MKPPADELALALVVDHAFLPGALVTIDSFRRHHRCFSGPIIIIHDESLDKASQTVLTETFDHVRFQPVRTTTRDRLAALTQARPYFSELQRRFYSLEIFALRDVSRVLFCDADLLFQAPIDDMLALDAPFVAGPDRATIVGEKWDENAPAPDPALEGKTRRTFNAGLMLVRDQFLNDDTDAALQAALRPEAWEGTTKGHTDQAVLNRHFHDQVTLAPIGCNYLLRIAPLLEQQCQLSSSTAQVVHFNLPVKPWQLSATNSVSDEPIATPSVIGRWLTSYQRALARRHHRCAEDTTRKYRGAQHQLEDRITSHLFIISPNNSGSTFLKNALESSRHTWNMRREGQHQFGVPGPNLMEMGVALIWAADATTVSMIRDSSTKDWEATKRAWYFHSFSRSATATVFVEKSPPHLLQVEALQTHFHNAKFIFLVRNPYAMAEGILRRITPSYPSREEAIATTARHILTCFKVQRENVKQFSDCSISTTYEAMCRSPEILEAKIRTLEPTLDDLYLDQAVEVKGMYHEPLRDMNAQQIVHLSETDLRLLQSHFEPEAELLDFFGYSISPPISV